MNEWLYIHIRERLTDWQAPKKKKRENCFKKRFTLNEIHHAKIPGRN